MGENERAGTVSRSFVEPGETRIKRWFLFDGDRNQVAGVLLGGVLVVLLASGAIWPIEYRTLLDETTTIQTVFDTLLGGVILLVSIVVSVAAVGISQELTSLGEQTDRVSTAIEYREDVERREDMSVSPAQSGRFLVAVLRSIRTRAADLETIADGCENISLQRELARLTADVEANVEELLHTLDRVEPGTTDELLVGIDYDCSWQLHQTRRLLATFDGLLTDAERDELREFEHTLRSFLTGREYFKSIYFKFEFSDLSTTLLGVSLPVIVFITYVLLALDAGTFPEITVFGLGPLAFFISLAYTIALAPYVVLTAYVVRAVCVTKRTMAAGPFTLEREGATTVDR